MSQPDQLHIMRHSMAHILASAVQQIYPEAKFGVGPVIDNGFYYDIDLAKPLSTDDLAAIEKGMKAIIKADQPFERVELPIDDAVKLFSDKKQSYKVELLKDLQKFGTTSAKDIDREQLGFADNAAKVTTVSLYKDGDFEDLCRGPHLKSTGEAGVFKLTRVSGAYWRGNQDNQQMQRIYGVAFANQADLDEYLERMEQAAARDHRKLGKELDLFTFSPLVGPGLPLWTPRGTAMRNELQKALLEFSSELEVEEVTIPHIAKVDLYQKSGHAEKFADELFQVKGKYQDFILKPVNCPHHTQIYASKPRSYRDLPIRYMESTMQYRDEKPGEIGGLTRVRSITLDDGHTFCTVDQIKDEAKAIAKIIEHFYSALGMYGGHWVSLSVRDPETPDAYIGDIKDWEKAEALLQEVSNDLKLDAKRMEGEAALYGPKLDFMFKDAMGNERQLATIQIDFAMPQRFGLTYTAADGSDQTPVMIHRAILGSYERFMALLIEHYAGNFPTWLAPEQVKVALLNDDSKILESAKQLIKQLKAVGLRASIDSSDETVGKKIRAAAMQKVPYIIVMGGKEVESQQVSPRVRADLLKGKEQPDGLPIAEFVSKLQQEVAERASHSLI